jgi:hypothetical protein
MIRKRVQRLSLATNAERVCAEIMRKQEKSQPTIMPPATIGGKKPTGRSRP